MGDKTLYNLKPEFIIERGKYLCIDNIKLDIRIAINNIYYCIGYRDNDNSIHYVIHDKDIIFDESKNYIDCMDIINCFDFEDKFILLSEWRQNRLEEILNG